MKVWARVRKVNGMEFYHSPNISQSVHGFREMGVEIVNYESVDEIYDWITHDDIVLDGITQCRYVFKKFGKEPHLEDYPKVLEPFLGRKIWNDTMDHINLHPELWNIFVKPISEKAFTGRVIKTPADLVGCGNSHENYEVLCSEIIDIKREWRGFMYYDNLIDLRPYFGEWKYNYDPAVIERAVEAYRKWEERPVACSLDFAVIIDAEGKEKTIFLEANDAYALGTYGLMPIAYAKLISARWSQILDRPDEFNFAMN